jgi:hypothetical protein
MSSAFSVQVDISKHNREVSWTWGGRQGLTPGFVSLGQAFLWQAFLWQAFPTSFSVSSAAFWRIILEIIP